MTNRLVLFPPKIALCIGFVLLFAFFGLLMYSTYAWRRQESWRAVLLFGVSVLNSGMIVYVWLQIIIPVYQGLWV